LNSHKSGYFLELNKIIGEKAGELKEYGYNMELTLGIKFTVEFAEFLKGLEIETTGILFCICRR
jgi:hypothetical protein